MADENTDKLSGQDENDYGFPFTEITPLVAKEKKPVTPVIEPIEIVEQQVETVEKPEILEPETKIEKKIESSTPSQKRKKSQLPLQFSLIMLILIILAAMAYFLYFLPEKPLKEEELLVTDGVVAESVPDQESFEEIADSVTEEFIEAEEDQNDQETAENIVMEQETPPAVQTPVSSPTGNLYQVRQGTTSVQYYIIVSSSATEQVVLDQAAKILEKNHDVWILHPYGENKNYRLSIAKYASFADASDALEKHKVDFGASIWILKY